LAKALLGKKLVRLSDKGERLCGIIVETEAYLGHPDKAAHSYKGMTNKNEPMFMDPGTAYVYHMKITAGNMGFYARVFNQSKVVIIFKPGIKYYFRSLLFSSIADATHLN
jgi:DNA-3-methyladenine glycosylase